MSISNLLEMKNIRHSFDDTTALEDFSIGVRAGEVVCLLGPSGCGKTTVLRVAAGLEKLQLGEIFVGGIEIAGPSTNVPPEKRGIGLVFQDYALFPHLTVIQNVEFGLRNKSAAERNMQAIAVLEQVGMNWARSRYPHTLSGGQQQRVSLARALAPKFPVILLDEPFSGLDARLRDRIREESLHILKESGSAALLVTHDAEEAMFMADRIGVMQAGSLVQFGEPGELYMRPVNSFVAEFFGEVNKLYGKVQRGKVMTPLGDIITSSLRDGRTVEILIRPEAISVSPMRDDTKLFGKVITSRMLGRSSLIHFSLCKNSTENFHLHSRVPGCYLPAEDEIVSIDFDPNRAFLFPTSPQV